MIKASSTTSLSSMELKFHPKSTMLERSLSKLTFVHQLAGLQCFPVDAKSLQPRSSVGRRHKIFLFINLLLFIGEMCGILFVIHFVSRKDGAAHSAGRTSAVVQIVSNTLTLLVISGSTLNNFFHRFKISETLSLLNRVADHSTFEKEFGQTMAKLFLSFILSNVAFTIFSYDNQRKFSFYFLIAVYPYFFLVTLVSYVTLLIRLIVDNLRAIEQCLKHLYKKHELSYTEPHNRDLRMRRTQQMINFILKLKRMYATLYDSTSLVNELMGLPICVFLVFVVLTSISGEYKVFLAIRGDVSIHIIGFPICTIFLCTVTLCTLIFACDAAYGIVDSILSQVHVFEFDKFERDAGISSIFLEFACQIVQRPIQFKVGGFYCLNQPFLASMVTGILTYVLLLVQFYTPPPK